jgi:quercetin dioxygenase-like cupin family protein
MRENEFEAKLRQSGIEDVSVGEMEPNCARPEHVHPYDVEAMVLSGEITLTCSGERRTYRRGDTFSMAAGLPHIENVGAEGVRYVVGRRHHRQ